MSASLKSDKPASTNAKPAHRDPFFILRPVYGTNLSKMRVACHLQQNEAILFGFQHTSDEKTEFAFTNLGLLWHTKAMRRKDFGYLDYATNILGFFEMVKIGQIAGSIFQQCPSGEEGYFAFTMGKQAFEIPVWRRAIDLVWTIKYIRVLQVVQREQLKQQQLQRYVTKVAGNPDARIPGFEVRRCYQQVILDAMASFQMKPPSEEEIDRDGRMIHTGGDLMSVYRGTAQTRVQYSQNIGVYLYTS